MIVYSRVMNGMINTTASEPYTNNTDTDFWIEHDDSIRYSPGHPYVKPTVFAPRTLSAWGATSMDNDPLDYIATAVQNA